jgi:hypothetical protein
MLLSEKLAFILLVITIFILQITGDSGLEIFFILILIAMLIIRESIEMFAPSELKVRMNLFIYIGVIMFFAILLEKLIPIIIDVFIT